MIDLEQRTKVHVIDENLPTGKDMIRRMTMIFIPRVGDELRFGENDFYKVTKLVWIYDEPDCPMQRLNIGVVKVD